MYFLYSFTSLKNVKLMVDNKYLLKQKSQILELYVIKENVLIGQETGFILGKLHNTFYTGIFH